MEGRRNTRRAAVYAAGPQVRCTAVRGHLWSQPMLQHAAAFRRTRVSAGATYEQSSVRPVGYCLPRWRLRRCRRYFSAHVHAARVCSGALCAAPHSHTCPNAGPAADPRTLLLHTLPPPPPPPASSVQVVSCPGTWPRLSRTGKYWPRPSRLRPRASSRHGARSSLCAVRWRALRREQARGPATLAGRVLQTGSARNAAEVREWAS